MANFERGDVAVLELVWAFYRGLGICAEFVLVLCASGLDFFVGKLGGEADCDDFCLAVDFCDGGDFYSDCECGDGRLDGLVGAGGAD